MTLARRLTGLLRRRQRARRFGVAYSRDKSWQTPQSIRLGDKTVPLSLPEDTGTRIAFKDIFLEDVYGLLRVAKPPRTILDVGAHAGLFSLYARLLFPQCVIHAYEPNPVMQGYLKHQAEIGNFSVFEEAVGGLAARSRLAIGTDSVFTKTVPDVNGEVRGISINEAIARLGGQVDLLKLDCEGSEWDILPNKEGVYRVGAITLEYHLVDKWSVADLESLITSLGFTIYFNHADGETNGRIWARRR